MTAVGKPAVRRIAADHPSIAGHFPGDPLVPGVLILEEVYEAVVAAYGPAQLVALRSVKFLAPLRPGEDFSVTLRPEGEGCYRFACVRGERVLVQGQMCLSGTAVTPPGIA